MRTLLFTIEYPPFKGGVANYYGNLLKYWPRAGEIKVLNNNRGELLGGGRPLAWLRAVIKLRRAVKTKKNSHVLVGQILPLGTAALICSKFCKIKYSVVLHGLDFTCAVKTYRKKFISKLVLAEAEKIICANNYVAKLLKQAFPDMARKIAMVNPGVENRPTHNPQLLAQLKDKYNLHNKIILLSIGRLVKRKGFDQVIDCLPKVLKQLPNLLYVIIGNGPEREKLKIKISPPSPLKNNVLIINQATDEERDNWYQACDIFIMPARNINGDFEGFGLVYLEANLAGKPVIAGQSGGVSDAVVDGLNGLLVDPENAEEINQTIVKLAHDPELRRKLGEQGRERAINDFNWKKQAEKLYKSIKPL